MTLIADDVKLNQLREYQLVFDRAKIGIVVLRDRVIQRCNRRFEQIFGYGPGELVGKSTRVYYPSDEAWAEMGRRANAMLADTRAFSSEDRYLRRDGSPIWCQMTGSLLNPDKPDEGFICFYDDVSERKAAQDALQALLREQTAILERAPTGILFVRERVILRCNPRFEEIFGYPPGALVGESTRVLFANQQAWLDKGVRAYGVIQNAGVIETDVDYVRRDGTPICCHAIGSLLDANNPAAGTVWLFEDITARRATEAALVQSNREHQLIFENALVGISYQRDRRILRCNRRFAEIFGYSAGDLVGESTRILFASDEDWEEAGRAYLSNAMRRTFDGEIGYRKRDGTPIRVHVIGRTVDDVEGQTWIWIYEDVTARRAAEEALATTVREYQLIFDNAMIGIAYTRDRVFLRSNRRFEEIFGFPPGASIGKSSRSIFASNEDFETVGRRMQEVYARGEGFSDEVRYCRRDGRLIWVLAKGRPIGDGQVWIWIMQDVTRRHEAEEALRLSFSEMERRIAERTAEVSRQLHFMEQLIEAIPGPVFYKDREGRYLGCNQNYVDFLGRPRSELIGATVYDIAPKDLADCYAAADEELFNNPGSQVYEAQVQSASGDRRDVMFQKATFANPDGSVGGIIGVMFDISERKRLEVRLQQAATVFDSSAEGITITAPDGTIIAVNRAFTEVTGYTESEVLGRNPRMLQSGRQDPEFYRQMWDTIARDGRWQGELWNRRKDGRLVPESLTISAVNDAAGKVMHYVGVFSDITEIKRANELLEHQAHHDHLTGLPNRLLLEDRLRGAVLRAHRERTQVAVLFVDLDRFKNINDSLGHHVGDRVLCEVAQRFRALTRESDTVARLGGDEFLIVMEGIPDPAMVSRIADKILDNLRANPVTLEQEFFIGASIGISLFPRDGADPAILMKNADAAMYRAKERGRNAYEFFTEDLTQSSLARFKMETDLRHAIERDQLRVFLQPQFSLRTGQRLGAEVLVRWRHPELGLVPPASFISLAEETGLIVALGEWVQQAACGCWAEWAFAGLNPGVLSINVSGVEFRRGKIEDTVRRALAASRLPPELLELEITESAMMSQAEQSIEVLHRLRAMGISLAIDDFGTGYSSLAYLKRLPLNKLKVDQSFVRDLPGDAEDCAIVRAVVALGHSLQLKVIAEGVETAEQQEFLASMGCDEMQGYLLGKPMPADDFRRQFLED